MTTKTVMFVGLAEEQVTGVPLPTGIESTRADTVEEAIDQLTLSPIDLIVTNDRVGELDSLDFFARVADADAESATPIVFLAPPGSGVQSFLYQRRRTGFEARYLDGDGQVHTVFVTEAPTDRAFTVRAIDGTRLAEELGHLLADAGDATGAPGVDLEQQLWEIGFNQDVRAAQDTYHVQTEVTAVQPVQVVSSVFVSGRAIHSESHRIRGKNSTVDSLRRAVEAIHATVVKKVQAGEIPS